MLATVKDNLVGAEKGDFVFSAQMVYCIGKEFDFIPVEGLKDFYEIEEPPILGLRFFHKSWLDFKE